MSELLKVVDKYRAALLRHERESVLRLTREYVGVWNTLKASLDDVLALIEAQDGAIKPSWLHRQARYHALMQLVEREIQIWADRAGVSAYELQGFGVRLGHAYVPEITGMGWAMAGGALAPLPRAAIETMVGMTANGSPLAKLFDGIGRATRKEWERVLTFGVTAGKPPRVIARMAHEATATGLSRATTIARTEMLRAFRVSSHETARRNPRIISGWVWCAALSTETCASCIAMNGTVHSMDEDFNDHPNGRCSALYITPSMSADDILRRLPNSEKWLKTLDDKQLDRIFGHGAAQVWKTGRVPLRKFATLARNDTWGDTYQPTPLYKLWGEM